MRKLSVFYEHILQACEQSGKTIPEVLAFCREQGISAVEVNYSLFASEREVIAPMLSDAGLVISCMHETFDFSHDTDLGRAQQMLDTAASQQVSRVLFVAGALETAEAAELAACSSTYEATSTFMAENKSIQNMVHALIWNVVMFKSCLNMISRILPMVEVIRKLSLSNIEWKEA